METYGHDFARLKAGVRRVPAPHAVLRRGDGVRRRPRRAGDRADGLAPGDPLRLRRRRAGARDRVQALPGGQMRFTVPAPQRRRDAAAGRSRSTCPASTTCATRWPRSRWPPSSSCPTRRSSRRWPSSPASAGASSAMANVPARGRRARFTLIDDYGHHPAEMAAVIAAARGAFPGRRLVLAFQPHRYTPHARLLRGFRQGARPAPTRCC